ncbi:MAG: SUMF1/EgtB/PvdO family nonheme iron enzyme [Planctomycetota bacterium]|jgi:formylglycine-generating enzyme required for sulfatase activity
MPAAMIGLAEAVRLKGQYDRSLEIFEDVNRRFPGTKEAAMLEAAKPKILFSRAFFQWKDRGQYDTAIDTLLQVIADHGDTEWAAEAQKAMPALYLDAIRQKIEAGQLHEGQTQLAELIEAYPKHQAMTSARELEAEMLFRLSQQAEPAGGEHYGLLLRRYPSSPWAVKAVRTKLSLERGEGDVFDDRTAQSELREAAKEHAQFEFADAISRLRGVVRYARAESAAAGEAVAALPAYMYEEALYAYGRGASGQCETKLAEVSTDFPQTPWAEKAALTLEAMKNAPEGMVYVPEGRFLMGTNLDGVLALVRGYGPSAWAGDEEAVIAFAEASNLVNETPQHIATTRAFYVDKTEVTNEQFKQFVDATGHPPPPHWRAGVYPEGQASLPVVNISRAEAEAYAKWRGARLPTEVEWEKAARGVDSRKFPWGDIFSTKYCHHMQPEGRGPIAVGSFPASDSPYGCLDMIGNVREWTSSKLAPYPNSEWQGGGPEGGAVARGGAWFQEELVPIPARCASRYTFDPREPDKATGFRCVRDVEEAGPAAAKPASASS